MFGFLTRRYSLLESGVLDGSEDAHSHILFGVDDGSGRGDDSLGMLDFEESLGVSDVWCTPHIMEDMCNTTSGLQTRFGELKELYSGPIRLHLAAEYMMDNLFLERLRGRDLLCHGGRTVLVETSVNTPPYNFDSIVEEIFRTGYNTLLAHPERYNYLEKEDYTSLVSKGVRLQLNLPSLTGYYGSLVREKAEWLLENGLYSAFGSDCHRLNVVQMQYEHKALTSKSIDKLLTIREMQATKR